MARRRKRSYVEVQSDFDQRWPNDAAAAALTDVEWRLQKCGLKRPMRTNIVRKAMERTMKQVPVTDESSAVHARVFKDHVESDLIRRRIRCRVSNQHPGYWGK